jgi:hypothetical protein
MRGIGAGRRWEKEGEGAGAVSSVDMPATREGREEWKGWL